MSRGGAPAPFRGSALRTTRGNLAGDIIETLRQDIATGRLAPGARLPNERDLAAHFGVSQPTIREAVRALDVMGLVDVRHGSGAYVRGDSAYLVASALQTLLQIEGVSIIDALDVREIFGRESVRLAAEAATDEDLALLATHLDRLEAADELATVEAVIDGLAAFQIALSRAAHNPLLCAVEAFLVNLLLQIQIRALRRRGVRYWRERSLGFQADRRAVVRAVEARDAREARRAMEAYLAHQREVFLADPDFAAMRLSDDKAVRAVSEIVHQVRST